MPAKKVTAANNMFAKIVYDTALSSKQKKEAIVKALVYDVARPEKENERILKEFADFKQHIRSEREELAKRFASLTDTHAPRKAAAEPAPESEKELTFMGMMHDFVKATQKQTGKVWSGITQVGENISAFQEASRHVVEIYKLVTEASAEASKINKQTLEKLTTSITQYNENMADALPNSGHVKNLFGAGKKKGPQAK